MPLHSHPRALAKDKVLRLVLTYGLLEEALCGHTDERGGLSKLSLPLPGPFVEKFMLGAVKCEQPVLLSQLQRRLLSWTHSEPGMSAK